MSEDTMTGDESPQSITDVKKKRRRRFIFVVVAIVLWYVITYGLLEKFAGRAFIYGENPGIYWLMFHQAPLYIAAFTPVVAITAALIIPGFLLEKLRIGVILLSAFMVFMTSAYVFAQPAGPVRHIQTVRYGNHIYHLADRIPAKVFSRPLGCNHPDAPPPCWTFSHEYLVYQCGERGVMCHNIGYEAFEEYRYSSHGELSVNAEGHIVLTVDNGWVWSYSGDDQ